VVSAPLVGVLALQGDVREHLAMLEQAGARTLAVRRPRELEEVDALVMPGGESTTMMRLARTFDLLEPVSRRLADGMPAFGTCAGMILLADRIEAGVVGQETFGGLDVVVRRNAFGRQVDSFEADLDVAFGGRELQPAFHAVFIRAPWVEKVGDDVEVVATVAAGRSTGPDPDAAAGRIVAVRQGRLLATSFHPEITGDPRFHEIFVSMVAAPPAATG
jgi:5'-phosphate synthase pdxT subunit